MPSQPGPRLFPGCLLLELQPYSPAASISALPESTQAQVLAGAVGWGWVAARASVSVSFSQLLSCRQVGGLTSHIGWGGWGPRPAPPWSFTEAPGKHSRVSRWSHLHAEAPEDD